MSASFPFGAVACGKFSSICIGLLSDLALRLKEFLGAFFCYGAVGFYDDPEP